MAKRLTEFFYLKRVSEFTESVADPVVGYGGGGEKYEIYATAFGGHLFCDFFYRVGEVMAPSPPGSATVNSF